MTNAEREESIFTASEQCILVTKFAAEDTLVGTPISDPGVTPLAAAYENPSRKSP